MKNKAITLVFVAFLGVFFLLNAVTPAKEFSDLENRYLAKMPELSKDAVLSGEFMQDYEEYIVDQFVARDGFVALKSISERVLGKKENNGVYIAQNGMLIKRFEEPDYQRIDKNIAAIKKFEETSGVDANVAVVPTASYIRRDLLPYGAPNYDQGLLLEYVKDKLGDNYVDLSTALNEHKDEDIYYRTDHHWTTLGAYYGYQAIAKHLGVTAVPLPDVSEWVGSFDGFYGTTFSSSGVRFIKPDTVDVPIAADNVVLEINEGEGLQKKPVYDMSFAEKKDKYSIFFGGNFPEMKITTQAQGGSLLVIKDSYANALLPFFFNNYKEIYVVDLRFNRMSMSDYVAENSVDDVLLLYSSENFATDPNIVMLR